MSLIRGLNPLESARNEEEALGAARATTIGLVIGAVWMIVNQAVSGPIFDRGIEEGLAGMTESTVQMSAYLTYVLVAVHLGLAALQWFKPNVPVPIIFLILSALALIVGLLGAIAPNILNVPTWQLYLTWALPLIMLMLHISGWRGASALKRFQGEY